jgi:transcription-repair coupling factor (superfamily II helicase)
VKQLSSISDISEVAIDPSEQGFFIKGFHPDLLRPLINNLHRKTFIAVCDDDFDSVIKYLEPFFEKDASVFIHDGGGGAPSGFSSSESHLFKRAKERLCDGLDSVSLLLVSNSGRKLPVIGRGARDRLDVSGGCTLEECCDFLKRELYVSTDFALKPGQYSIRGGMIDVFLYSSDTPYRINFLDGAPIINNFNVDTQLTTAAVSRLEFVSVLKNPVLSINEVDLSGFLSLIIEPGSVLKNKHSNEHSNNYEIKTINFRDFSKLKGSFLRVGLLSGLSSVGILGAEGAVVPDWFLKKKYDNSVVKKIISPIDLSGINKGDFLVHRDHGVCVFMGLVQKFIGGLEQEFVSLIFSDKATILVDIARLDIVTFYARSETEGVKLDSLSKKGVWARKKASAKAQAEETIMGLLNLYVKRGELKRPAYSYGGGLEKSFISSFPHIDTADQLSAWREISGDLSSSRPMDRLVCGDVGFGKTELAIRAAFRVVLSEKRVVVLSPTTILAKQLYYSFFTRVDDYGVSVEMVSRFRSKGDIVKVQGLIKRGLNDVLIGTHAVLNNDIYLKNIGLVIIDEEHRFGVRHKEKIREFKGGVDVLSMSATPIPRSMNMAISKIYSISTLQTPPKLRLPIKTSVEYYSFEVIRKAILFETARGGQVYFVHNDVNSIKGLAEMISSWFESLVVDYIHGQEASTSIEKKMVGFVDGKTDVLVCTTIIESGIDVSNANCIIINNSHLFGLSQLYQMRGRVGRGRQQAYAYLLIPRGFSLSEKSFKRIKSIEENTTLGSGYAVSMTDMEIRGGGSLFGYRQSGGSGSLGYEMYTKMIQRSLHGSGKLDSGFKLLPEDVVINVYRSRLIPEAYVSVESVRVAIYKNISMSTAAPDLENISFNLRDRFGPLPLEVDNLLKEQRLKILASKVGVFSIGRAGCGIVFSIKEGLGEDYIKSFIDYIFVFFKKGSFEYHVVPSKGLVFSLCVHLDGNKDIYTFFSYFLGKFNTSN